MLFLFTIFGQIWLGIEIFLPHFYQELSLSTIIGACSLLGISISTLIFFYCSYFLGFTLFHLVLHTLALFIVSFVLNKKRRKTYDYVFKASFVSLSPQILISFITLIFIFPTYLSFGAMFLEIMALPIHEELSLSASFLNGCNKHRQYFFSLFHPDMYGKFALSNWLTSCHYSMIKLGYGGFRTSLLISTTLYIVAYFLILSSLAQEFLLPIYVAPFSVFLPLFIAGFGYFKVYSAEIKPPNSDVDYISQLGSEFPQTHFMNPFFQIIFGNRPMLFSLGLSSLVILLLYRTISCRSSLNLMKIVGFIVGGILPCVIQQSFFAMMTFSIFQCLFQCWRQRYWKQTRSLLGSFLISFLVLNSIRFIYNDYSYDGSHFYTDPKYIQNSNQHEFFSQSFIFHRQFEKYIEQGYAFPFLSYWFDALGFYPFILFGLSWFVLGIIEKQFFIVLFLTFLVFNFWQTQENPDKNMLTFYSILFTLGCVIYTAVIHRISSRWLRDETKGIFSGVFFVLTVVSMVSSFMGIKNQIMNWEDNWSSYGTKMAEWVIQNTPENSVFYSKCETLDPILSIAGRIMFYSDLKAMEYEGFDYTERKEMFKYYLNNPRNLTSIKPIDYIIFWKSDDTLRYFDFPKDTWALILSSQKFDIYQRIRST
ncbi:hypothetical protein TRFO_20119 [Tritrichomonas foetus]|uniref:Uncharacterized protein n=1 Tax=Tritrichomonas foetus TaxID=1144522 RepID=A0A1J4KMD8_9EUKA|nr:hypothetical protein TRFO_20119 [Tritrichomonas foetus]|eukprot:OHT10533.1 hypothetical protein TRFO_20119 [Tritrichomonas foetus]